jgi:protein SCO1/2
MNRLRWLGLVLVSFAVLAISHAADGNAFPEFDRIRILESGRSIKDIALIDQDGKPFNLRQLQGKIALVFFGFTNCPDVCPMTMTKFQQLHDAGVDGSKDVAYVMISVDSDRDSPARLKDFLSAFSSDFIGLTGDSGQIKRLAKEFSASFYKGNIDSDTGSYSVAHSPQSFVLDRNGMLRAEFYNPTIEAMTGATKLLLAETSDPASN